MTPGPGVEPGPHWWEASALTTAPSLLACELAEVTSEAHLKPGAFTWLLTAGNLTVLEERFLANCLLHDFEIFLAAAVMTGIYLCCTILQQGIQPSSWIFRFIEALRADPQWKKGQCSYSHTVRISTQEAFTSSVLITSRTSFSRGLFMSQDPRGRSFQLYGKKNPKKHYVREQDERYLIL